MIQNFQSNSGAKCRAIDELVLRAKVELLGQVFTPQAIIDEMLSLRRNQGKVLEPSSGDGAFLASLGEMATGIEIDRSLPNLPNVIRGDFFAHSTRNKYQTIIGNPPYVRYQDILPETKRLLPMELFDKRSNLYLFFMEKCIRHLPDGGELIFITPRDFLKATSARKLNQLLYEQGSFTYYRETGDSTVFSGYTPNCAIWRWQKGLKSRDTDQGDIFNCHSGQIWFGDDEHSGESLGAHFDIKVGAVSGADHLFASEEYGNEDMVCSSTVRDKRTRKMIYNQKHQALDDYKEALMSRKIRTFNDDNWWEWGRKYYYSELSRIYVNCKTREQEPFFPSDERAYDGSVLALIPKSDDMDVRSVSKKLNQMNWDNLGFVVDGRLIFTQRSLANAPVPLTL